MATKVGVLALQGAFLEHQQCLRRAGANPIEVRLPEQLADLDGLILPGGESTAIGKLMQRYGFIEPLRTLAERGFPLWGTCAGMILMGRELVAGLPDQPLLQVMDLKVTRNAFGRQIDSFSTALQVEGVGELPAVFIRAPVAEPLSDEVRVLATYQQQPVALRQGNLLATSFHPELSGSVGWHRWFVRDFCSQSVHS